MSTTKCLIFARIKKNIYRGVKVLENCPNRVIATGQTDHKEGNYAVCSNCLIPFYCWWTLLDPCAANSPRLSPRCQYDTDREVVWGRSGEGRLAAPGGGRGIFSGKLGGLRRIPSSPISRARITGKKIFFVNFADYPKKPSAWCVAARDNRSLANRESVIPSAAKDLG